MFSKQGIKISSEQFDTRLKNFKRLDPYIDSKTSIRFECVFCGKIKKSKPKEIKSKLICNCELKHIEYSNSLISKNITTLERYINIRSKLKHRCSICNSIFESTPKSLKNSLIGCPSCSGRKFDKEVYKSKLPNNILLIEEQYTSVDKKHLHKCITCNHVWNTKPNYILHMKTGCPKCKSSKGEKLIAKFLEDKNIHYIKEYKVNIESKIFKFDFYIPQNNLIIEYDGIHHFKPIEYFGGIESFKKIVEYDKIKSKWCEDNGYSLCRISYKDDILKCLDKLFQQTFRISSI